MTRKFMTLTSAGAIAALTATPVMAQENVADWDADQNQTVTQDEFNTGWGGNDVFGEWDQDDDDALSQDEFDQGVSAGVERTGEGDASNWADTDMASWDEDQSGDLNEDEFNQGVFGQYDQDQSGDWNESEWSLFQDDAGEEGFWDW